MSRCFPYHPPGYCRNGTTYEALIESIKLQKETNKIKTERKKEKKAKKEKKEKKQKEKRNLEDEVKLQKNTNGDSQMDWQKTANSKDAQIKGTNATTTELFEKSDLTEEHGPSIGSHQPSYSSDSTQNSNKRKREHSNSLHDSSTAHGKPLKIRFLQKHKESESNNFVTDARSNVDTSVPSSSKFDRSQVSSIRLNGVPATSGRGNITQTKSNSLSEGTKVSDPNRPHVGTIQSAPISAKTVLQSRPQLPPVSSFERRVSSQVHLEHEIPSSSGRQQQSSPRLHVVSNPLSIRPSTSASVKRAHNEITVAKNDGLKKQKEDTQKVVPSRSEKKMMKKHAKYEKLVGSWVPPVFQAHLPDGDEDWLSGSKTSSSLISKGEVETCRQLVAPWQPCARFLAEVDIHALPYTVPF